MATHYDTLGVARGATPDQIRRAYHVQARRWHPDRSADRSPPERRRAEDAMRRVNEAWRVLGDDRRRREYDHRLDGGDPVGAARPASATSSGPSGTAGGTHARIDPRLLDPEYLAARRRAQVDHIERGHAVVLRSLPWIAVLGFLAAIVVFSAYQGGPDDETTAFPGQNGPLSGPGRVEVPPDLPEIGVPADACVRILSGPSLQEVACSGPNDGAVVAVTLDPTVGCPGASARKVVLRNEAIVCLAPSS